VRSKASINQLNLPHGTKTKPDIMLKTVSSQSPLCQSGREWGPMVGRICERGRFWAGSERV